MNFYIYDKVDHNNKETFELVTMFKKNSINYIVYMDSSKIDNFIYIGKIVFINPMLQIEKLTNNEKDDFLSILKNILMGQSVDVLASDYNGILDSVMLFFSDAQKVQISNDSVNLLKNFNLTDTIEQLEDIEVLDEIIDNDIILNDISIIENIFNNISADDSIEQLTSYENLENTKVDEPLNNQVDNNQEITISNDNVSTAVEQVDNLSGDKEVINNDEEIINNYEVELLQTYIGENYDKITKENFSMPALFLSGFYFLYRKMYSYGIVLIIFLVLSINLIILFVPNIIISLLISIALYFLLGLISSLTFNNLYLKVANQNISQVKEAYANSSADDIELLCKHEGGTNSGKAFLLTVGIVLAITLVFILLRLFVFADIYLDDENVDGEKYEGVLIYSEIDTNDIFSIDVPKEFTYDENATGKYIYETDGVGIFNECDFTINGVENYTSAKKLIKEMSEYSSAEYKNLIINKTKWYSFVDDDALGTKYIMATDKSNQVYLFEYTIGADANQDVCQSFYDTVVYSIKYK